MKKTRLLCQAIACLALLSLVAGCQTQSDADATSAGHGHDHGHDHDHAESDLPESLRDAVAELSELRTTIDAAVASDDPESAHEPLHKVGKLLKAMPDLAADTDLAEAEWEEIKQHVDQLFESYSEVDSAFHQKDGDKQAAYEAARSSIDEGVAALEAKLPLLGGGEVEAAHAHDRDHDEEHEHDHEHDHDHDHEHEHDHEHDDGHDDHAAGE